MNLSECILTANDCYKAGRTIVPKGVMIHSTGANNTSLKRYVQPLEADADYDGLIALLGVNVNGNDWNRSGLGVCVHAFIGRLADGSVGTVQTLPWNWRGWHSGTGTTGASANDTHISFEICEDDLTGENYFRTVYRETVELTAMLCREYDLDPLADGVVLCHSEGYRRGIASNHADVENWFPLHDKTMDDFRADVAAEMEEDNVTQEQFNQMMETYLTQLGEKAPGAWSAEERAWAEQEGIIRGAGSGNMQYQNFCTREQVVAFLYRLNEKLKAGTEV